MNETCQDFDLCETCEAHPIPVHPVTHPLLKMKTLDTRVPAVFQSPSDHAEDPFLDAPEFEERMDTMPEVPESPISQHFSMYAPPPAQVRPLPEVTPEIRETMRVLSETPPPMLTPRFYMSPAPSPPPQQLEIWSPAGSRAITPPPRSPASPIENPFNRVVSIAEASRLPTPPPPRVIHASVDDFFKRISSIGEATMPPPAENDVRLIDLDEPAITREEQRELEEAANAEGPVDGFTTPSDAPISSSSSNSVPRLGPVNNEWRQLWPEVTSLLQHLLQPPATPTNMPPPREPSGSGFPMPGGMIPDEPKAERPTTEQPERAPVAVESPLVGEPLLCRPLMPERPTNPFTTGRRLSEIILAVPPVRNAARNVRESIDRLVPPAPLNRPAPPAPLLATFVSDNNIADGQVFPPGAEFVKSWRMKNIGAGEWPETTELVFVAGDRMAPRESTPMKVHVGVVKAGAEVEVVAGEMKVRCVE